MVGYIVYTNTRSRDIYIYIYISIMYVICITTMYNGLKSDMSYVISMI
jgi:hypothetical protein